MAYIKRKRPTRSRRTIRRKYIPRVRRSLNPRNVHWFQRMYQSGALAGNALFAPYLTASSYQLSDLPGVTDFANLFDQYMITKVELRFFLQIDPSAQAAASAFYPKLVWAIDRDTATAPASLNEIYEYGNSKSAVLLPTRPVKIVFKPSVLGLSYQSAVASTYTPKYNQWVDMSNTSTPHYGLRWAIDNFTNTNYSLIVHSKYTFACKNTR